MACDKVLHTTVSICSSWCQSSIRTVCTVQEGKRCFLSHFLKVSSVLLIVISGLWCIFYVSRMKCKVVITCYFDISFTETKLGCVSYSRNIMFTVFLDVCSAVFFLLRQERITEKPSKASQGALPGALHMSIALVTAKFVNNHRVACA